MTIQHLIRRSLYIDFEGEGRSSNNTLPLPHMVGEFRPNQNKKSGKYSPVFFKRQWHPAANGAGASARTVAFSEYFQSVLDECKSHKSLLIFWSDHERNVLEKHLPKTIYEEISPYFHNLLIDARSYSNARGMRLLENGDRVESLNQYFAIHYPKRKPYPLISPGPAETCRRIDDACTKHSKWCNFSEKQKAYVKNLIDYNRGDLASTWLLALKLANAGRISVHNNQRESSILPPPCI